MIKKICDKLSMNGNNNIKKIKLIFIVALSIIFHMNYYLSGKTDSGYIFTNSDQYFSGDTIAQNVAGKSVDNSSNNINSTADTIPDKRGVENKISDSITEKKDIKAVVSPSENDSVKSNKEVKKEKTENIVKPDEIKKPEIEVNKQTVTQPAAKENKIIPAVKPVIKNSIKIQGNGLLEVENVDFKYKRIPGITIIKEKRVNENVVDSKIQNKEISDKESEKGLFGLRKSTSDMLVKIIFILIIIGIIILFKFRSKTRPDKNVLRRFPGA